MVELRDYQQKYIDAIHNSTAKNVLVVAPVGSGKSMIMQEYINQHIVNKTILIISHSIDINEQLVDRFRKNIRKESHNRIIVETPIGALKYLKEVTPDYIIIDECHHAPANTYQVLLLDHYTKLIGFTATPERGDGVPLGDTFSEMINLVSMKELIELNYLVPIQTFTISAFTKKTPSPEIVVNLCKENEGKKIIIFCINKKHAELIHTTLKSNNINNWIYISGHDSQRITASGIKNSFGIHCKVLVVVSKLSEGVDVPQCDCVVMLRPIVKSLSTYIQQVGRGSRIYEGKTNLTVYDLVGNFWRYGSPEEFRHWSLNNEFNIKIRTKQLKALKKEGGGLWSPEFASKIQIIDVTSIGGKKLTEKDVYIKTIKTTIVTGILQKLNFYTPLTIKKTSWKRFSLYFSVKDVDFVIGKYQNYYKTIKLTADEKQNILTSALNDVFITKQSIISKMRNY